LRKEDVEVLGACHPFAALHSLIIWPVVAIIKLNPGELKINREEVLDTFYMPIEE